MGLLRRAWQTIQNISREEFEKRLEKRRRKPSTTSHRWEINTTEGRHIGWVDYYRLDVQAGHAYIGICLPEKDTWGKGYGTEALSLLINYLLREMGLKEVKTATWTGNKRMVRCARKCGFKEITRRPHRAKFSIRGEPLERIEFSITRSEWLARGDGGT